MLIWMPLSTNHSNHGRVRSKINRKLFCFSSHAAYVPLTSPAEIHILPAEIMCLELNIQNVRSSATLARSKKNKKKIYLQTTPLYRLLIDFGSFIH